MMMRAKVFIRLIRVAREKVSNRVSRAPRVASRLRSVRSLFHGFFPTPFPRHSMRTGEPGKPMFSRSERSMYRR